MPTPAQSKATNKYNSKNYDKLTIRIRKDGGDKITAEEVKTAADSAGESLNSFIIRSIKEHIRRTGELESVVFQRPKRVALKFRGIRGAGAGSPG